MIEACALGGLGDREDSESGRRVPSKAVGVSSSHIAEVANKT